MIEVTAVNLTPDFRAARPDLGARHLGAVSAGGLVALLESLRSLDPVEVHDADPHLLIDTRTGRRVVRTGGGKLFLYAAPESRTPMAELEPEEAMDTLERPADWHPPPRRPSLWRLRAYATAILATGLLLAATILHFSLRVERVASRAMVQPIDNDRERSALQLSVVGRYVTGTEPGDRAIEISPEGRVQFSRKTEDGERIEASDTYRIGRCDGRLCVSTLSNGLIEIRDIDTVVYYRSTYRRPR